MTITQKRNDKILIPGFDDAPTEMDRGIFISASGEWGTGKTEFMCTAPGPIAFLDMDTGTKGVIEKWAKKKIIKHIQFDYRDSTSAKEWEEMWEKCKKAFLDALAHPQIRSVCWDTGDEGYELIKMGRWGKLNKIVMDGKVAMAYPYGPLNTEFRDMFRKALHSHKVVIVSHKMQDEYIDKKSTGKRIRTGYKEMEFVVQVDISTWKRVERNDNGKMTGSVFGITVNKCRPNREIEGTELEEPLSTFPILASYIFPDTNPEDWE